MKKLIGVIVLLFCLVSSAHSEQILSDFVDSGHLKYGQTSFGLMIYMTDSMWNDLKDSESRLNIMLLCSADYPDIFPIYVVNMKTLGRQAQRDEIFVYIDENRNFVYFRGHPDYTWEKHEERKKQS
jgi:hypothetical protein